MATTQEQARLVLKTFSALLQNNLITEDLVTWQWMDGEFTDRNALTIVENVPPRFLTTRTSSTIQDLTGGVQDIVLGSEQYRMTEVFGSSMSVGDFNRIRDIGDARMSESLKSAALNMAETIDAYILGFCANASNNFTGTPGNLIDSWGKIASGYTRLKEEGCDDAELRAVLQYDDWQALGANQVTNNASLPDLASGTYRNGFSGSVAGIPTMFTQQLPGFTSGTRTNGTVAGANQNVNYSAVSISPGPGQYMTQLLNVGGLGANGTVKDGEVFTIAGVFAYDNRAKKSLGRLQQFRVIGDATADGAGAATLRIFPAIIVPAAGISGNNAVNTANATVTNAPANAAAVVFSTAASSVITPRFLMNKSAIVCNTMDLIMPSTGMSMRQKLSKLPLSVRMWKDSVFATGEHRVRFDVCITANVRDRRRLVRIGG